MSEEIKRDEAFFKMADAYIQLANEQCENEKSGKVSMAMQFGVARFNAFIYASMCNDPEEFKKDRETAIKYFTTQFQEALNENLDDYLNNYTEYMASGKK